jgi:hypothetical protein
MYDGPTSTIHRRVLAERHMSSEVDEWNAAAKKGAAAWRKKALPAVAAALVFVLVFGGVVLGLGSRWGEAEAKENEELAERGLHKVCIGRHCGSKEQRDAKAGLLLFIIGAGAGTACAVGAFFALGGTLSPEYKRGLNELGR